MYIVNTSTKNPTRLSVLAGDSSTALEARRGNSRIVISTQAGSNPLQIDLPASPELDSSTNLHQTSDRLIEGYFYSPTNNNNNSNIDHYQPPHWILSSSSANLNNNYPVERWVFRTSITCNEHSRPWIFPIY
jgi:hypothetical protein